MLRPFRQVDVFTTTPYRGNPVAVVLDGDGLDDRARCSASPTGRTCRRPPSCCRRARPSADYRVRIFTPVAELPFAGHPTLGTCHAWLEAGGVPTRPRHASCRSARPGWSPIRRTRRRPRLRRAAAAAQRAGRGRRWSSSRVGCCGIDRGDDRRRPVGGQRPGLGGGAARRRRGGARAAAGARSTSTSASSACTRRAADAAFEVRAFFPKDGATAEDPVTGSLNASLAEWLLRTRAGDRRPTWPARGRRSGGPGACTSASDGDGTIWVGRRHRHLRERRGGPLAPAAELLAGAPRQHLT